MPGPWSKFMRGKVRFVRGDVSYATVNVDILETSEEHQRGLMHWTSLPENEGALFEMGFRDYHAFWMKNTKIPLDLIFIDGDWVVGVLTLAPLDERKHRSNPSTRVLEVRGGWAKIYGVCLGDRAIVTRA